MTTRAGACIGTTDPPVSVPHPHFESMFWLPVVFDQMIVMVKHSFHPRVKHGFRLTPMHASRFYRKYDRHNLPTALGAHTVEACTDLVPADATTFSQTKTSKDEDMAHDVVR